MPWRLLVEAWELGGWIWGLGLRVWGLEVPPLAAVTESGGRGTTLVREERHQEAEVA